MEFLAQTVAIFQHSMDPTPEEIVFLNIIKIAVNIL